MIKSGDRGTSFEELVNGRHRYKLMLKMLPGEIFYLPLTNMEKAEEEEEVVVEIKTFKLIITTIETRFYACTFNRVYRPLVLVNSTYAF